MHSSADRLASWSLVLRDAEHLVEALAVTPDAVSVERAPQLTAIPPDTDHAAEPQHSHVPGDPRLAHAQVVGELADVGLAHLPEALQDAQPRGVGEGEEVVGKLVARALKKHKGCFIEFYGRPVCRAGSAGEPDADRGHVRAAISARGGPAYASIDQHQRHGD